MYSNVYMNNNYLNKKTQLIVGYRTAKKQGLFSNPQGFNLPSHVGLDLKNKRVVSFKNLKDKINKNQISLSDVYLPDSHLYMPETKRFVMATPTTKAKQAVQMAPKKEYFAEVSLYKIIPDHKHDKALRYLGSKRHFKQDGKEYQLMKTSRIMTSNSVILEYANKKVFTSASSTTIRSTRNSNRTKQASIKEILSVVGSGFQSEILDYVACVVVGVVTSQTVGGVPSNPIDVVRHKTSENKYIYNSNTQYTINTEAKTFSDLFLSNKSLSDAVASTQTANSCFVNLLHETYYDQFEKLKPDGKRCYKELTRESLMHTLGLDISMTQNIGLSLKSSIPFFEKYHLGLQVFDIYNSLIFSYEPEKRNAVISPSVFRAVVHNNHIYKINANEKKLQQTVKYDVKVSDSNYISNNLNITSNYNIIEDEEKVKHVVVDDLSQIVNLITASIEEEGKIIFIVIGSLEHILFEIINAQYTPSISFRCGIITSIYIKADQKEIVIKDGSVWADNETLNLDLDQSTFDAYTAAYKSVYNQVINKSFKSEYNQSSQAIDNVLPMGPCGGYFKDYSMLDLNAVDMRKAYTDNLMRIENVPVYSFFDTYIAYDGHQIEPETVYIVKGSNNPILFPTTISRCYGIKLTYAQSVDIAFEITHYKRPSNLIPVDFNKTINDLYESKIDTRHSANDKDLKKQIVNTILGLTEKKRNNKTLSKLFNDYSQALHYQLQFGGVIYPIEDVEQYETIPAPPKEISQLDAGVYDSDDDDEPQMIKRIIKGHKAYILQIETNKDLTNGFMPIKEMIYEHQKIKLHQLYLECQKHQICCIGVRTDCILVIEDAEYLETKFNTEDKIGGFKIETAKRCIDKKIEQVDSITQTQFKNLTSPIIVNTITINDEYDTKEINKVFDGHNRVLVKGNYPGVGKTTTIKNYGKNTLFISPYNKLCQQLKKDGHDAITLNKLLCMSIDGDIKGQAQDTKKIQTRYKGFDVSEYDVVCFDEVMLYGPKELGLINNFIKNHPSIKFLATGDADQLKPFTSTYNNVKSMTAYLNRCRDMVFSNQFVLQISKRLKTAEDREKLNGLKVDIFDKSLPIETICKKYGLNTISNIKDVSTKQNITYFNYYADIVNDMTHKKVINKGSYYYKGLELVCKAHFTHKQARLYVNYIYTIQTINSKTFTVREPVEDVIVEHIFETADIKKYFRLSYANTCHSVQGLSISEKITIFNSNIDSHVDRHYLWTALTRATDFNNVSIFIHGLAEVGRLSKARLMRYYNNKITSYKSQDAKKGRSIDDADYVDAEWIMAQYNKNKTCSYCSIPFEFDVDEDELMTSNLTVDRINNDKPHTKANSCLCCHLCNVSKK